jgi:uroporphyrinogen decarboxylase
LEGKKLTSKERVKKAIKMQGPDRVPLLYAYNFQDTDILNVEIIRHFTGPGKNISEWGFELTKNDENFAVGQAVKHMIKTWDDLDKLKVPDPHDETRFYKIKEMRQKFGPDKYYKANFNMGGFNIMHILRGFGEIMEDLYLERDKVEQLADKVFGFEEDVIRLAKVNGYDGIGLADDWGSQDSLLINPAMWREIFKPRYKRQIEIAHENGLDVYMHSCGYIYDIIPDLIEIGLDIINPGQPDINNIKRMGDNYGGKICFACPVSYQTTGVSGTKEEIYEEIREYVECLGSFNGGLAGVIPEDAYGLGITKEKCEYMVEAYKKYGQYS